MFYLYSEGWRSAVGSRPHIRLPVTRISSINPRTARYSKLDITIDRFGQEEDVTGASFAEPITYLAERKARRTSSRQMSRSLSKQSDVATLSNAFTKFSRRQTTDDSRSYKIGMRPTHTGPSRGHGPKQAHGPQTSDKMFCFAKNRF